MAAPSISICVPPALPVVKVRPVLSAGTGHESPACINLLNNAGPPGCFTVIQASAVALMTIRLAPAVEAAASAGAGGFALSGGLGGATTTGVGVGIGSAVADRGAADGAGVDGAIFGGGA